MRTWIEAVFGLIWIVGALWDWRDRVRRRVQFDNQENRLWDLRRDVETWRVCALEMIDQRDAIRAELADSKQALADSKQEFAELLGSVN